MPARRRNFPTPGEMKEMEREQNERRREKEREEMEARRRQRAAEVKADEARHREEAARRRKEEAELEAKMERHREETARRTLRRKATILKSRTAELERMDNRLNNIAKKQGMMYSHGKFKPKIEEVSSTQLKAPKPPKPPKPKAIKHDNTQ